MDFEVVPDKVRGRLKERAFMGCPSFVWSLKLGVSHMTFSDYVGACWRLSRAPFLSVGILPLTLGFVLAWRRGISGAPTALSPFNDRCRTDHVDDLLPWGAKRF